MTRDVITRTDGVTVDLQTINAEVTPLLTKKMANQSSGQPTYIGEAMPGTATSTAKWRIRKMEYDDGDNMPPTGETWADGVSTFTKSWDLRATYVYS